MRVREATNAAADCRKAVRTDDAGGLEADWLRSGGIVRLPPQPLCSQRQHAVCLRLAGPGVARGGLRDQHGFNPVLGLRLAAYHLNCPASLTLT